MSNVFADDRAAIADALAGLVEGWNVYDHLPGRAVPPCYVVMHDAPLLAREQGDPFGSATARYEVWCCSGPADNQTEAAAAEAAAWAATVALTAAGFTVETVDQPIRGELNGTGYLTIPIHLTSPVTLT